MKVVIDGNIGSGKTTQLNKLESAGLPVRREPIEKWPLDLYYSDPVRWGFLFQMIILQTLKCENGFMIYERSPISSRDVFWEIMEKTDIEDAVYRKEFDDRAWYPDVYILIDKAPETCYEHLCTRDQAGDSGVTYEYLKQVGDQYEKMFKKLTCVKYKIDGNQPIDTVYSEILNVIKKHNDMFSYNVNR